MLREQLPELDRPLQSEYVDCRDPRGWLSRCMKTANLPHPWAPYRGDFETSPVRGFGEVSMALLDALEAKFAPTSGNGTALAIDYPTLGVAADSARRSRRGGAHNRADRQSDALTSAHVANLMAAEHHASAVGLPFTRMITIHWEDAGVPLEGMAKATRHFLDLLSKFLSRHGTQAAWLWVHENGDNKGGHCHILAHVPADLAKRLAARQRGWLRRITGKPYKARVIHSKPIGGRLGNERANPVHHAANLDVALGYVLKGANEVAADRFDLMRLEDGGKIIGKRCGTSQNIGPKARKGSSAAD